MAELQQVVVDCAHPAALARFWAAVLDGFEVRPYDSAELERLAARGLTPETDPSVIIDGPHVELCFQVVDPPPNAAGARGKRPLHLDVTAQDVETEVVRLVGLGATVAERFDAHVWMRDPEGNDFCVVRGRGGPA